MTILLIVLGILALALLAPVWGTDSRPEFSGRDWPVGDKLWSRHG